MKRESREGGRDEKERTGRIEAVADPLPSLSFLSSTALRDGKANGDFLHRFTDGRSFWRNPWR